MFGYVRASVSELKVKEYALYRSVYCGLCKRMRASTGRLSSLSLNYDFVFFAVLQIALRGESPEIRLRRCAVHPLKSRPMLERCDALTTAARVSALFTYCKCLDTVADTRGIKRLGAKILLPAAKRMHRRADLSRKLVARFYAGLDALHRLEAEKCPSPDAAADCFGQMLAPLCAAELSDAPSVRIAEEIGFHLGRWIYLMDAADDAQADQKSGSYNPFVLSQVQVYKNEELRDALRLELEAVAKAAELIQCPDPSWTELLRNILYFGLPDMVDQVLGFVPHPKRHRDPFRAALPPDRKR